MTAPGFVPATDTTLVGRLQHLERRVRSIQQNVAGATTADGGVPLSGATPQPVGTATAGSAGSSSRADHVHSSTLATQGDVTVSSPATGQGLVWNGTRWVNQALSYVPVTYLPALVSGGGLADYLRWSDLLSTMPRMTAVGATPSLQTLGAAWPLPAGATYTMTGIRYCLTTAATATASVAVYLGSALNTMARQGSVATASITTGTNGVYSTPFSAVQTVTPVSTQYVLVLVTFTAGQTVAANETAITTNTPWETGALWGGTATVAITLTSTYDASAAVTTTVPWMAIY